ncbi:MAG: hypothetical protein SF339_05770 [Blastocatellia bacterium]|nr:hypothetical protein [Blastocatellia bacterium]
MKFLTRTFRFFLLLAGLLLLADSGRAQSSSLVFSDAAGRRLEFTPFGTIVNQQTGLVSRGYSLGYHDGSTAKRVYYLNNSIQSGIVPVSLSADQPTGQILTQGQRVYVRAVVRTADGKLTLTFRYIWRVGAMGVEAIGTMTNNTDSQLDVEELSLYSPLGTDCSCPCTAASVFDGATIRTSVVIIANVRYRRTALMYGTPLQRNDTRDTEGCDPVANVPLQ